MTATATTARVHAETAHPTKRPRRLSSPARKLVLSVHIIASGGWFGVAVAMLILGLAAAGTDDAAVAGAGYSLMTTFGRWVFPAAALTTISSGAVLSLGTKWGLVRYRWIVVKLVLTAGVIMTGVQVTGRLLLQADAAIAAGLDVPMRVAGTLTATSAVHLVALGTATVISLYKPWGKTRRGQNSRPQ